MVINNVLARLRAQYDRLIAVLILLVLLGSLLYLAAHIGMIRSIQKGFDHEIQSMRPKHEHAEMVETGGYVRACHGITQPFQVLHAQWTNDMLVPETRVYCIDCRRPIPFLADLCPFCDVRQPIRREDDPEWDTDRDGIPDMSEKAYGLDPFDPADAERDKDGDGFSNIAEHRAKTDPTDPKSFPPPEAELRVLKIVADPFKLRFRSVIKLPDGSLKFAINTRDNARTYFKKLGEEVEGFLLFRFEQKTVEEERGGMLRRVDVSVLTLKRGSRLIPLQRGKDVQYNEYTVHLLFAIDNSEYVLKLGNLFELKGKKYKLIDVDSGRQNIVIRRQHDGKDIDVGKFPGEEARRDTE